MSKWKTFRITNTFDDQVIEISWDGIKREDAVKEIRELAKQTNRNIFDYRIKQL
jgi:hypothetical protein